MDNETIKAVYIILLIFILSVPVFTITYTIALEIYYKIQDKKKYKDDQSKRFEESVSIVIQTFDKPNKNQRIYPSNIIEDIINNDSSIFEKDFNIHSWHIDCDGLRIELNHLLCRGGTAYLHKYGYIWSNGEFLTKRECRLYGLKCGKMNTRKRIKISE